MPSIAYLSSIRMVRDTKRQMMEKVQQVKVMILKALSSSALCWEDTRRKNMYYPVIAEGEFTLLCPPPPAHYISSMYLLLTVRILTKEHIVNTK